MGFSRHLGVCVIAALAGACTWNNYDGQSSGTDAGTGTDVGTDAGGGAGVLIDSNVGGVAVSSDGLFEIQIPADSLNVPARVTVNQTQPGPTGPSFAKAYLVSLVAEPSGGPSAQLWHHAPVVTFHLAKSGFNVPASEVFIAKDKATLPGGSAADAQGTPEGDVFAIQTVVNSGSLGPYTIMHLSSQASATACPSNREVCGTCWLQCSKTTGSPAGGVISSACYCASASPECARSCVDIGQPGLCN